MANCIQLIFPGIDERDTLQAKRQYVYTIAASSTTPIQLISAISMLLL